MMIALAGFAVLLVMCFAGVRVGFASMLVGIAGISLERGFSAALTLMGQQIFDEATNYNLSVIPLFILMGVFIYRAELSRDLYDAAYAGLGRFRGGLALSTVLACAGFSAVCGSSLATAATMTKVAMPPMREFKYSDRLAAGTIAAGGTLGIMIPPSVPLVIYGIVAEQDIGRLFMAGILPGLLLVGLFMGVVGATVLHDPEAGPVGPPLSEERKRKAMRSVWPVLALFTLILGGIYGAVFTPTEAAGIGAIGAAAIAVTRGRLRTLGEWRSALVETTSTTAKLFIVVFGALIFAQFINLSGMPYDLLDFVQALDLTPTGLVLFILAIAIVMGMIFESIGILLLLVPVFLPALYASGVDMIWFGILIVLVTELGLISPPIGMNVFIVKSVARELALADIFIGVTPFILAMLIACAVIFAVPGVATFLPDFMR
ncbi:TRAP transporter large permease [Martelella soudanensis]|uniref:TRAP transporter large permease n=1 Tax=unclassified Martelella TaxID=2629616 RepID=UPI0015DE9A99|nr:MULTISPECIES: TRAP transporter large permease [unclassified Martelella]